MRSKTVIKQIKRLSALLLAACLLFGTLQAGAVQANAAVPAATADTTAEHSAKENDPLYYRSQGVRPSELMGGESDHIYIYGAPANSKRKLGMDVSYWQGDINWKTAKAAGIKFVIIRVGYRGLYNGTLVEDPRCREYIRGAKAAGIKVGVYMFSQAVSRSEAVEEAKFAMNIVRDYDIDLPIVIDREYSGTGDGRLYDAHLSRDQETAVVNAFCDTVAKAGYIGMLYTGFNWLTYQINAKAVTSRGHKVWIARWWYVPSAHSSPEYSGDYDFWQWSADGNNMGHTYGCSSKDIDLDYWYDNGSLTESTFLSTPIMTGAKIKGKGITVTWKNIPAATSYRVYRRLASETAWTYCAKVTGATAYVDTASLKSGQKYYYTVRAYSDTSHSSYDPTGIGVRYLGTPALQRISNQDSGLRIDWGTVKGAKNYQVYRKLNGTTDWEKIATTTKPRYIDKTAKSGRTYDYTVRAVNGNDMSLYQKTGLTSIRLATPEIIAVTLQNDQAHIIWHKVKGAKKYNIYRKTSGSSVWELCGTVSGASHVEYTDPTRLKSGKSYYYMVRAYSGKVKSCYNKKGAALQR